MNSLSSIVTTSTLIGLLAITGAAVALAPADQGGFPGVLAEPVRSPDAGLPGPVPPDMRIPPGAVELPERRELSVKVYRLADGEMLARMSASPFHYRDALGDWQDIDPTIRPGVQGFLNDQNSVSSAFSLDGTLTVSRAGHWARYTPTWMASVTADGTMLASLSPGESVPQVVAGALEFVGLYPGATNSFEIDRGIVRNELVLGTPLLHETAAEAEHVAVSGSIDLSPGLEIWANGVRQTGDFETRGGISFMTPDGELAFLIYSPYATDANYPNGKANSVDASFVETSYSARLEEGRILLTEKIPAAWFFAQERAYPLRIDPTWGWNDYDVVTFVKCDQNGGDCNSGFSGDSWLWAGDKEDGFDVWCVCEPDAKHRTWMRQNMGASDGISNFAWDVTDVKSDIHVAERSSEAWYDSYRSASDTWTTGMTWNGQPSHTHTFLGPKINAPGWWTTQIDPTVFEGDLSTNYIHFNGDDQISIKVQRWNEGSPADANIWIKITRTGSQAPEMFVTFKEDLNAPDTDHVVTSGTSGENLWRTTDVSSRVDCFDNVGSEESGCHQIVYRTKPPGGSFGSWTTVTATSTTLSTITAEGTTTIEHRGRDKTLRDETAESVDVKIDKTNPTAVPAINPSTPNGANQWYTQDVSVSATYNDPGSHPSGVNPSHKKYWINRSGSVWQSGDYSNAISVNQEGASYTFDVKTKDMSGRQGSGSLSFKIDKTGPVLNNPSISGNLGGDGYYLNHPTVTLSASDGISNMMNIEYKLPWNAGWSPPVSGGSASFVVDRDGSHVIQWRAKNNAGLQTTGSDFTVKVDTTKPATSIQQITPNPNNGWYTSDVTVTLQRVDDTSGIKKTWYKFGSGGTPVEYTAPFTITTEGTTTVHYWSEDKAGNVESSTCPNNCRAFSIDKTNPTATATTSPASPNGNNNWYRGTVTGIGTCSDPSPPGSGCANPALQYRWDSSSTWQTYNDAARPTKTADGRWTWQTLATDVSGRTGTASKTVDLDNTPPALTADLLGTLGNNQWYTDTVTITASQTDALSLPDKIHHALNCSGPWTEYNPSAKPTFPNNGEYSRCIRGTDRAGNEAFKTLDFKVDVNDPVGDIVFVSGTLGSDGWYRTTVQVRLDATDNAAAVESGVASVDYRILQNGAVVRDWTTTSAGSIIPLDYDGENTIEMRPKDLAGNVGATDSGMWRVDIRAPTSTATVTPVPPPAAAGWIAGCASISVTAVDPGSGVATIEWRLNGGSWSTGAVPNVCTTSGTHQIEHRATDNAGNVEAVRVTPFKVDMEAPTCLVSIHDGVIGGAGWYTTAPVATITASDPAGGSGLTELKYRILTNGAANPGWTTIHIGGSTVAVPEGRNVVECQTWDLAGYASTIGSASANVDRTPPTTGLAVTGTQGQDSWYLSCATATLTPSDALSGVKETRYRILPGGAWTTYTTAVSLCSDGTWTFEYFSSDHATNVETTRSAIVKVDRTMPDTWVVSMDGTRGLGVWWVTDVSVTLGCSDETSQCRRTETKIDGGAWTTYGPGPTLVTGDAVRTFRHRGLDMAGNFETENELSISIDKTAPTTTHSFSGTLGNAGWYKGAVTTTLNRNDALSGVRQSEYELDGGPSTVYPAPVVTSPDGTHQIRFRTQDNAGNWEAWSTWKNFQIDKTAPVSTATIQGGTLLDGGWRSGDVRVAMTCTDAIAGILTSGCATREFRLNGGAWTPYSDPVVMPDGDNQFCYRSHDVAGNVEAERCMSVKVDNLPPITSRSFDGPTWIDGGKIWVGKSTLIRLTGADSASGLRDTKYQINGGTVQTFVSPFSLHPRPCGEYTITGWSTDNAGHVEVAKSWVVWFDCEAPVPTWKAPLQDSVTVYDIIVTTTDPWSIRVADQYKELPVPVPVDTGTVIAGGATFEIEAIDALTAVASVEWYIEDEATPRQVDSGPSANNRYSFWWEPNTNEALDREVHAVVCDKVENCVRLTRLVTVVPLLSPTRADGTSGTTSRWDANMQDLVDGTLTCIPTRDEEWKQANPLVHNVILNCVDAVIRELEIG